MSPPMIIVTIDERCPLPFLAFQFCPVLSSYLFKSREYFNQLDFLTFTPVCPCPESA